MTEKAALTALQRMLRHYTIGSVLHLLAEANRKHVEETVGADDPVASGRCDIADHVLFCVGVGLDAAMPQ
jgi:hypothetical protein